MSALDLPLDLAPLAVVDVETTGLSARGSDRIVEIAIVVADGTIERERFVTLVDPERPSDPRAVAVHGITDAMLRGQPRFHELRRAIEACFAGRVIVGHNVGFDLGFLRAEFQRAGALEPTAPAIVLDTLRLARACFAFPSNGLSSLASAFALPRETAHRALGDALTTWRLFHALAASAREQGVHTVRDWLVAQGGGRHGRRAEEARQVSGTVPPPPIAEALRTRGRVELLYATAGGLVTRRVVRPLAWTPPYLRAFCEVRREERTFRVDRMAEIRAVAPL